MCSILLVGHDLWLLQTRALILRQTEAEVYTSAPNEFEQTTCNRIDLLILCHTLNDATRHSVSAEARRRWPQVRVLQVSKYYYSSETLELYADDVVPSCNPRVLVDHARRLMEPMPCEGDTPQRGEQMFT
jgi:DNA-binding response OmpR family regulator